MRAPRTATLAAFLILAAAPGWAGSVDTGQVTTFANGQPADAGEMNTTLQALIAAIDDNAARLAALEASQASQIAGLDSEVDGLEGRVDAVEAALASAPAAVPVAGTWHLYGLEVEAAARNDTLAGWNGGYRLESVLTLNADGTFSISEQIFGMRTLITAFEAPCFESEGSPQCIGDVVIDDMVDNESESDSGTWSVSGGVLTLTYPGPDGGSSTYSIHGGVLAGGYAETDSFGGIQNRLVNLTVGVRVGDVTP